MKPINDLTQSQHKYDLSGFILNTMKNIES